MKLTNSYYPKLTNISEVQITFEIWSGPMVTCNKGLFSLHENIHAQVQFLVVLKMITTGYPM